MSLTPQPSQLLEQTVSQEASAATSIGAPCIPQDSKSDSTSKAFDDLKKDADRLARNHGIRFKQDKVNRFNSFLKRTETEIEERIHLGRRTQDKESPFQWACGCKIDPKDPPTGRGPTREIAYLRLRVELLKHDQTHSCSKKSAEYKGDVILEINRKVEALLEDRERKEELRKTRSHGSQA